VLLIEEECIRRVILAVIEVAEHWRPTRLADSECRLRGELEAFKDAAVARETELKFQIDKLRNLVHNSPPVCYSNRTMSFC
jgi:hypothetical protein